MSRAKDIETLQGQLRHNAKFHRILDAALAVFVQNGFHNAKISEVARAAGVADGTIYLYFKNKDDLLASLFDVKLEALAQTLRDETHAIAGGPSKLTRVIDFHIGLAQTQAQLIALLRHEVHVGYTPWGSRARAAQNPYLTVWLDIIEAGVADGSLVSTLDAAQLMQLLFGALDHVCNVWASRPASQRTQNDLQQARDFVQTTFVKAISAKP